MPATPHGTGATGAPVDHIVQEWPIHAHLDPDLYQGHRRILESDRTRRHRFVSAIRVRDGWSCVSVQRDKRGSGNEAISRVHCCRFDLPIP